MIMTELSAPRARTYVFKYDENDKKKKRERPKVQRNV